MKREPPVTVIGAGRAGLGLAHELKKAGYAVPAIVTRRAASAVIASRRLGRGTGTTDLAGAVSRAGIILISVPDREIPGVVGKLASLAADLPRRRIFLHTSGVTSAQTLAPLRARGAFVGTLHPLVSFPSPDRQWCSLRGATFAVDGDAKAQQAARKLIRALGGSPIRIAARDRAAYHLVSSLLANGMVALLDEGFGLARKRLRMSEAAVRAAFTPLLATVLANVAHSGTGSALTGPVVRGDIETVKIHLEQLAGEAPPLAELYRLLARAALKLARNSGRLDRRAAARIERVLRRD